MISTTDTPAKSTAKKPRIKTATKPVVAKTEKMKSPSKVADLNSLAVHTKKERVKKPLVGSNPGPQSYAISYNVAELKPRGGNFGMSRDKFL